MCPALHIKDAIVLRSEGSLTVSICANKPKLTKQKRKQTFTLITLMDTVKYLLIMRYLQWKKNQSISPPLVIKKPIINIKVIVNLPASNKVFRVSL